MVTAPLIRVPHYILCCGKVAVILAPPSESVFGLQVWEGTGWERADKLCTEVSSFRGDLPFAWFWALWEDWGPTVASFSAMFLQPLCN